MEPSGEQIITDIPMEDCTDPNEASLASNIFYNTANHIEDDLPPVNSLRCDGDAHKLIAQEFKADNAMSFYCDDTSR